MTICSMGIEVAHFTQKPCVRTLSEYLKRNFPGGQYLSAYEAGFCGTGIHEQLRELGIDNIIVHAADIPVTDKQKKNKTDLRDSRTIASNLQAGRLTGIHILSREQQELRSMFRLREARTKEVTRANNRLKAFLMYFGIELPEGLVKKEYLSLKALEWLSNLELASTAGSITLRQYIEDLKYQRKELYRITKSLREQVQLNHLPVYDCLVSLPGIGGVTSMGLIAEIADFSRFDDPDQYCSFLGFCPWEDSSGDTIRTKGMQPRCNRHLRPLLIEASWIAIRTDRALFAYYSKHARRSGKQAIVKVARKLALMARAVALSKQKYQPDYLEIKRADKKKTLAQNRFSSGMQEKHKTKKPGNVNTSLPD